MHATPPSLSADYYFPLDAYPYLHFLSYINNTVRGSQVSMVGATTHQKVSSHNASYRYSQWKKLERKHSVKIYRDLFTNVAKTNVNCFIDSTTCVRHAVPLDECGNILYDGMEAIRRRVQPSRSHRETKQLFSDDDVDGCSGLEDEDEEDDAPRSRGAHIGSLSEKPSTLSTLGTTQMGGSGTESAATRDRWLKQRAAMGLEKMRAPLGFTSSYERRKLMQMFLRTTRYLFQSPYWLDVATVQERWGVDVVAGAEPVNIKGRLYVNAEETTDAARFNATTCTPRRIHEVLTEDGLFECDWDFSMGLHAQLRCKLDRAPSGGGGPRPHTFSSITKEAAAMRDVCNLWISQSVVDIAGWHVDSTRCVWTEIPRTSVHRPLQALPNSEAQLSDHRPYARSSIHAVHAECLVERDALIWLLSLRPVVYYDVVDDLGDKDEGYSEWTRLQENLSKIQTLPTAKGEAANSDDGLHPAQRDVGNVQLTATHDKLSRLPKYLYLPAPRRLEMGLFALHKGYSVAERNTWVLPDFLKKTQGLVSLSPAAHERGVDTLELETFLYSAKDGVEPIVAPMKYINTSELVWPKNTPRQQRARWMRCNL